MITLFHGSNQIVEKPVITNRFRTLDFGEGFYTTTNREQAEDFALKVLKRRNFVGVSTVNCYEFSADLDIFNVLKFDSPNEDWLDFIVNRRKGVVLEQKYDLIIGPVANDDVFATILLYERGIADKETTIKNFKIKPLYTQYLFCNELILEKLIFVNSYEVSKR